MFKNTKPSDRQEYILCAAVLCRDEDALKIKMNNGPVNIPQGKGIVFTGHRHKDAVDLASRLGFSAIHGMDDCVHGFLTSKNHFMTRAQAMGIAIDSGQATDGSLLNTDYLY